MQNVSNIRRKTHPPNISTYIKETFWKILYNVQRKSWSERKNSDITNSIDNGIQTSKDTMYASILETPTSKISGFGRQLSQSYSTNMDIICTDTKQSGEARTRLSSKSKYMNWKCSQSLWNQEQTTSHTKREQKTRVIKRKCGRQNR